MVDQPTDLVDRMQADVKRWMRGDDIRLDARYAAAVAQVGAVPFLAELFCRFGDSTLAGWLSATTFVWKDLDFESWKQILRRILTDRNAIYQFVPFASEYLGIDIPAVIRGDPSLPEVGREYAMWRFPRGGPDPGSSWLREKLSEYGVDQQQMWRRLAAEGAPMKVTHPFIRPE